jgi:DNA polymerase-3 subunit alpha
MNALYRPGPMDYIPDFIARKHGRKPIQYDIPVMEERLKDTYGITVYQEQVMLLSRDLAGFTRGQSDELRKAMGKKLIDKMNALKEKFVAGCKANGHDEKVMNKIWEDWVCFASYAFNKSHATCYSWVAHQTAYLKANYPSEYMAAVLSRNISNITEITKFMDECRRMGIEVLGPEVNESNLTFTVNKQGNIRFGLGAVKGVGANAVAAIVEERTKGGAFRDIFDFVERVSLQACNKKNMEALAPTPFTAPSPKRMFPCLLTVKVRLLSFTSGPSTSIPMRRHSSMNLVISVMLEMLRLSTAAMYSDG